jgi:hypothetical protein
VTVLNDDGSTDRGEPGIVGWTFASVAGNNLTNWGKPFELPDMIKAARKRIAEAEKNKKDGIKDPCADLLGSGALAKFDKLLEDNNVVFGQHPDFNSGVGATHVGDKIILNADSFTFDPDYKISVSPGAKAQNEYAKKQTEAFNEAFKKSGASSRYDYAVAAIIHEFLHVTGEFGPDVTESIFSKDSSQSRKNQKQVIEKCFSGKK